METILTNSHDTTIFKYDKTEVSNYIINYNQEYVFIGGINISTLADVRSFPVDLPNSSIFKIDEKFKTSFAYHSYIHNNIHNKNSIRSYILDSLTSNYLTPSTNLYRYKSIYSTIPDLINTVLNISYYTRIRTRTDHFYGGAGSLFNRSDDGLFSLVVKKEALPYIRLKLLSNGYIDEKDAHLFKLYVKGGFDYKDTPYPRLRTSYRKTLLPLVKKLNIPIETYSNITEKLFITKLNLLSPTGSLSVREQELLKKEVSYNALEKLKNSFSSENVVEIDPLF